MNQQLILTPEPIREIDLASARAQTGQTGAVVTFLGVVRATEDGRPIQALEYEAFATMAEHQFHLIFHQLAQRWPVQSVRVVHRTGRVPANQPSLWVEIVAPHRAEAFAACQFLIDEMKRVVPIWKKPVG